MTCYDPMSKQDKKWFDNFFGITKKRKEQRWTLTFNKNVICFNVPYPVCVSQKKKMINSGEYRRFSNLFEITKFVK